MLKKEIERILRHEMITDPIEAKKKKKSKKRPKQTEAADAFDVFEANELQASHYLCLSNKSSLLSLGSQLAAGRRSPISKGPV